MGAGPVQFLHFLILGDGYMIFKEEFQNPPVEYRIKPFWFWNGDITKEEISHQIKEMADKGLGGMFICARQGMTIPYLSKEWFEMVEYACAEARRYGLEAWLYDEYPYPSGMSGGEVLLEHPEAEHMILVHKKVEKSRGGEVEVNLGWSRVLFAKAYPVDKGGNTCWDEAVDLKDCIGNLQQEKIYQQTGLTKYNNKRFFSYGPSKILKTVLPELAERTWRIELYMEMAMGDFKYYGGFFDPCNKEAVRTFLETTHERYEKAVGDQFGITVHGMFSDEVGLLSPIPWSKLLPEEFEKRNGYSLLDCMPALHDDSFENAMKVRYDLYETAHILFRTSYHKQVSDWCREHHLQYATEVPSMRHSTQRYSDIVGGDTAHEKLGKPLEWIYDEYIHNYRSKNVYRLDLETGKICNIPVEENAVVIRLGSFESQWIQISNNGTDNKISHNSIRPEITIPLDAEWKMKPLGKNFCRFGYVDMSLNRIEWENVEVKTFIEQCDSTKLLEKQQLRFSGAFGTPKKITPAYPLACWYRVEFQMNEVPEDICIFMDRETMAGSYQLFINGKKADQKDWYDVFVNDKNNQALNIYSMVKEGKNSIEIQMNIEKDEDGLRDPLYLWGSFGVTETAGIPLLTKQPETGCPDRHWCKGFPYYSGTMEYETCMKLEIPVTEQQVNCFDIKLGFQVPTYDCIETRINGVSLGVKAYTPYVWQCPRDVLQKDENIITIAVTNTLANMLDGTYFDYDSQKLVNIEP